MGPAWEVPVKAKTPEDRSASMLRAGMTIEKALTVQSIVPPGTLLQIAKTGDTVGVKRMIDANCLIEEAKTSHGFSALHPCAIGNFADTANVILEAHGNQQYLDAAKMPGQITPLYFAAHYGSYDTAKLLLKKGASVNKCTALGATPLFMASPKGFRDVVELLVHNGGAANALMHDGATPLLIASYFGRHDDVELLIHSGGPVNAPANDGTTSWDEVRQQGHHECANLLIGAGARTGSG